MYQKKEWQVQSLQVPYATLRLSYCLIIHYPAHEPWELDIEKIWVLQILSCALVGRILCKRPKRFLFSERLMLAGLAGSFPLTLTLVIVTEAMYDLLLPSLSPASALPSLYFPPSLPRPCLNCLYYTSVNRMPNAVASIASLMFIIILNGTVLYKRTACLYAAYSQESHSALRVSVKCSALFGHATIKISSPGNGL